MMGGDKKIRRFEDIVGWQKARELVRNVDELTSASRRIDLGQI